MRNRIGSLPIPPRPAMGLLLGPSPCPNLFPSPSPVYSSKPKRCASLVTAAPVAVSLPKPSPISSFFPSKPYSSPATPIFSSHITRKKLPRAVGSQQQKYVYPDPIPEFAEAETQKFEGELLKKLSKDKETFGNDIDLVIKVCSEIFRNFLYKEYGGPGTLLVEPFTDMLLALKERKLPGGPVAARAALLWAQNYVDRDWDIWTSQPSK